MASPSLAIAKAHLTAAMIKPDPTTVPRDEINDFHNLLDTTVSQCSPANVQKCRVWLVKYAQPSRSRVGAIAKYLVALASARATSQEKKPGPAKTISGRRQQLHILYLLNDFLHHSLFHSKDELTGSSPTNAIQPYLIELWAHAAVHKVETYGRHHRKLTELLDTWENNGYYPEPYMQRLRGVVSEAGAQGSIDGLLDSGTAETPSTALGTADDKRKAPFVMPAFHGDPSAPYYELPAANMLPHIVPNSGTPINPQNVKAMQLASGPASVPLARAVADFLKDADSIYAAAPPEVEEEDEGVSLEMDEMGQTVARDKTTRETVDSGDSYYGWSKAFCERMKQKKKGSGGAGPRSRGRRRSISSQSRSPSPRKRARYSSDESRSRSSRSRSRGRYRRDYPSSRPDDRRRRGRSDSHSPPRHRSRSPPRQGRFRSRDRSRSESYSPPQHIGMDDFQVPPPPPPPQVQGSGPLPFPNPFPNGIPLGPDGMPLPPPRPPNWQGPWPPPPPPLPTSSGQYGLP